VTSSGVLLNGMAVLVALWKITSAWEHELPPGSDRDFARSFTLSDGEHEVQTTVDVEEPPPRRLLVGRDERVSVVDDAE
jgi:hypothetical protein